MTDLVAFLEARLAEDQRQAKLAVPFKATWSEMIRRVGFRVGIAEFITMWDPARVLAEIAAKRRILARHAENVCEFGPSYCTGCRREYWPCPELCAIAIPYADHEDFDKSWRT